MNELWLTIASEAIMAILGLALLALSTIGSFYLRKLMASLEEKDLVEKVAHYVRWVEQSPGFQDFDGEEKFMLVLTKAVAYLEERGIDADVEEIAVLIESTVKLMKEAAAPILP